MGQYIFFDTCEIANSVLLFISISQNQLSATKKYHTIQRVSPNDLHSIINIFHSYVLVPATKASNIVTCISTRIISGIIFLFRKAEFTKNI